jgi:Leucine-rich repeat (LRR) protein
VLGDDFFTNVTELDLSRTEIADEGLTHLEWLPRLRSLSLGERVTDAGVQYLERLPQLRTLKLARTQITDAGIQRLQKALPSCTIRR